MMAALGILGACSHGDSASNAQDQAVVQNAASDAPAPSGDASDAPDSATSPIADAAAPTGAPSGGCRLIDAASVGKVMHASVDTVKVDANSCDFSFKTVATNLTVEFDAQGGAGDLDLLKKTVTGVTGALNGAASGAPPGIARMAPGLVTASTPRGIPKLGDDQFASGPSPALFLGVRRGDTYVQISGAAMPDGVDPWAAAADLVRETFANQH